jgi:hypothetical protein
MVGMEDMTSPFLSTILLLLQPSLAHVNQPKVIITSEGYHVVIITTKQNVETAGGEEGSGLEG